MSTRPAAGRGTGRVERGRSAGGSTALRAGQKVLLTFRAVDGDGMAVGTAGGHAVRVPFAAPGEEALVEIVRPGRPATGRIVTLMRKSPEAAVPRCRHFGVCGGCQWQHMGYQAQLRYKSALVRTLLAPALEGAEIMIADAIGTEPWAYRTRLQAAFGRRGERIVAGFYAAGEDLRIINVRECPIQHEPNVAALDAGRAVIASLGWPLYDHVSRTGLVRGLITQIAPATGERMVVLSATADLPDRMAYVRAMREAVPGLVSLILSVQPRRTPDPLGRLVLLWGRAYIEDEIAGIRVRVGAEPTLPPAPRAASAWLEAIGAALDPGPDDVIVDTACGDGLVPVWLARRTGRVIGVAPDREAMHRAWEQATINGVDRCVFYTRDPGRVVAKLRARGERIDAALITARRAPAPPALFSALREAGARRLALAGSSLALLAADLRAARDAGFSPRAVQPLDLLPQTSRVHAVVSMVRAQGT